jgi:hypothetical protein
MESIKGKSEELKWFKGMMNNRDGRTKWFERTKTTYEPCKRSAFDTAGAYEEASGSRTFDRDFAMYKWLPVDEWIIRQRLLGECGDGWEGFLCCRSTPPWGSALGFRVGATPPY